MDAEKEEDYDQIIDQIIDGLNRQIESQKNQIQGLTDLRARDKEELDRLGQNYRDAMGIVEQYKNDTKRFPVLQAGYSIPWKLIAPYDAAARKYHDQDLKELSRRGGLAPEEIWCIVHDKKWREAPSDTECNQWLRNWAGLDPSPAAQTIRDQARQIQVREGHIAVLTQLMERDDELQDLQRHGVLTPEQTQAALAEHRRAWEQALLGYDHDSHGRGTAESGPDDPDCPCRDTVRQAVCATAGCGFCLAAQTRKTP